MQLTNEQLAQLTKLQQKELDAAFLYRRLAELAKTDAERTALKKIAADEARHAAIASKYTGAKLSPSKNLAFIGGGVARVIGLRKTMKLLAKAENLPPTRWRRCASSAPRFAKSSRTRRSTAERSAS